MEQSKTCTKCRQIKALTNFHVHNGANANKDGYRSYCKDCSREANRIYRANNRDLVNAKKRQYAKEKPHLKAEQDRRYRLNNVEKIAKSKAEWNKNNLDAIRLYRANRTPEQKQKKRDQDIAYGRANRQKNRLATRKYRLNNPERAKLSSKKYAANNPQIALRKDALRRTRLETNGVFIVTRKEIRQMREQLCFYCKERPGVTIDHVIPIARGGTHSIGNLVAACQKCNSSKCAKTITEWNKWKVTNESKTV